MSYYRSHPYFGHVFRPGSKLSFFLSVAHPKLLDKSVSPDLDPDWMDAVANDFGFFTDVAKFDFANTYKIAVLGGSVATFFALQRSKSIKNFFIYTGLSQNKTPVFFNLSHFAHKQPVLNHVLLYFASLFAGFDFVICINGFNECTLSFNNISCGYNPIMPASFINDKLAHEVHYDSVGSFSFDPSFIVKHFSFQSKIFSELVDIMGSKFLHVLQPNQYFSSKKFSEYEKANSYNDKSFYCEYVRLFYPHFIQALEAMYLANDEVYLDATRVFDQVDETIFIDACCHLSVSGNYLLEKCIETHILKHLNHFKNPKKSLSLDKSTNALKNSFNKLFFKPRSTKNTDTNDDIYTFW